MQRYHAANCSSAVNNSAIGLTSARESARAESPALPSSFPLNSRLGPPDYHPQTPDCPEETLTREYVQSGYKEMVEGLEEAREILLTQVQTFTKPVVLKCKEAIRKRLRAINESRAKKRKAGQVYGVPLSGTLLSKAAAFPEQRPCTEDFRRRWIEGLSQPHKRLRSLADHVPHGYRRKSLFEILIKNNVPLLRATWFIKVSYLNQIRPGSSGTPDKSQLSRTELWTKDVIDYLQYLLDEFIKNNSHSNPQLRDRSPQVIYSGSTLQKGEPASSTLDGEEPSLHFKWCYVVRLLQWHHAEGLLLPSPIIEWVLNQLQDKEIFEILQLLLPIIYGVIEAVVLSQSYVQILVGVALRYIREPSPGGSYLADNSRRAYTCSAVVEMLRYMMLAVPDTFVSLDCFPLPSCVVSHATNDGGFVAKASEDVGKMEISSAEIACMFKRKRFDALYQSKSFHRLVSCIRKRSDKLAKSICPGNSCSSYAKAVQALDKALVQGDLRVAYKFLFEDFCEGALDEGWIKEVSPCLRSSLKCIETVNLSFIHTVFFLCEWATCDFRNFRTSRFNRMQFTGRRDFSEVYAVIWFLKMKARDLQNDACSGSGDAVGVAGHEERGLDNGNLGPTSGTNGFEIGDSMNHLNRSMSLVDVFDSPGPLHDILVCWIDQHEAHKGETLERLQLLIVELTRFGIFYPQAYVRQLLVSGILDLNFPIVDVDRHIRHCQVLKLLPEALVHDALKEMKIADGAELAEAVHVYSNERQLVLRNRLCNQHRYTGDGKLLGQKLKKHHPRDVPSPASVDHWKSVGSPSEVLSFRKAKSGVHIDELKTAISALMQFPSSDSGLVDTVVDESEGSVKRPAGSMCNKVQLTDGCEECRRVKKQKLTEERSSYIQVHSPTPLEEDDLWWARKGPKLIEPMRIDPPLKTTKQTSRGRQKVVRKTQSLAQLAAARIEGSQGASTSHVCDNRISCPHHRTVMDGEIPKVTDANGPSHYGDIIYIGKALRRLRFAKRRMVTSWLINVVRQLVDEAEKASSVKVGQFNNRSFTALDDLSSLKWKLSEDELSGILYLMDVSNDLVLAIKFLLWLLPKALRIPNSTIHSGRNLLTLQRHMESHVCEVGEAFLLSSLRRYENTLIAADLIPQTLSALMHRAAASVASNGRVSGTSALAYARYLLKKYGAVSSVMEWRKNFKAASDKRLLSELESGRSIDGEHGFSMGAPTGADDLDDLLRQKLSSSRLSRVGMVMREIVQRHIEGAFHFYSTKEKKLLSAGGPKGPIMDKGDEGYQKAQQILMGLMDCIRQTGGAAQEGDPSLICSAVSAIVGSIGPTLAKVPDFSSGSSYANTSLPPAPGSYVAKRILRIHITSLCLLKEALGERQSRVFEVALATEALSALSGAFSPGKVSRNQYQLSPESHDSNLNTSMDSAKGAAGRATKIAAAVSALVIGSVLQGVTSLERMVTVFRLKDGLDVSQFVRSLRSNSNGNTRSPGPVKGDGLLEVYIHWFRLLVGSCRTVSDGLIVELLGEPSALALSRMQQTLPLRLVFPPAYAIFAVLMWRPYILNGNLAAAREDIHQLYVSLNAAMNDALRHFSFRDVCLRNTQGLYDLIAADRTDTELAETLDVKCSDVKSKGIVPLCARHFLNAILDCRIPSVFTQDEPKALSAEIETRLVDKIVHVLNTLQPAKFHWQWLELRLLLNEQALIEKLESSNDSSLKEVMQSLPFGPKKAAASDNESNVIEIILTRLLVRPDASPLYSEAVHLLGRSLEDSLLLMTKWFLEGNDVLFGRKTVRQRLINIAETKGLSISSQSWKHWGWAHSGPDNISSRNDLGKRKYEMTSLEEGEFIEECLESKKHGKGSAGRSLDAEANNICKSHATEKALIELILLCMDQSSDESRYTFASDLIKQLSAIEQQMNAIARGTSKQAGTSPSVTDSPVGKTSSRKGSRGGSPGMAARRQVAADPAPPSPAALRASISLRLHFLLRSLPVICADREPSGKNMRHMLAPVMLHLLGNRLIYEDAELPFCPGQSSPRKRDSSEMLMEAQGVAASLLPGESLFDRMLLILHGLLSSTQPSWLKSKRVSAITHESMRDFCGFEKEVSEKLQNELESMQLPDKIRWRIQAAMPVLVPSVKCSISCQPPSVPQSAIAPLLQPSTFPPASSNPTQRTSQRTQSSSALGKSKASPAVQLENEMEFDSWTLLEDGVGSAPSSGGISAMGSADGANLRASSWLKGAVRVRRTDLTYVGPVDEDS
ncbi:mediator of RNA polymerase II transcription subunit 12 isoform X2 [Punica granatum]|uniref:Mediator of RNA polymerase II transcription subunit 12 isoform X2 n=2 Tax=Punica granatum TaxID=22663 RepID=A0A6P8DCJ1_PUNGR|nr:mediator of RNA polymerase II transcription subunit 12 isoform X2 [Punica granatum]PKI45447.1 hypothetical protein CRG98_034252 [Punica granatum]